MKKQILVFIVCLFITGGVSAQEALVNWSFVSKRLEDNINEITIKATIKQGWHIYSQQAGEGPVPTSVEFIKSPLIIIQGKPREIGNLRKSYSSSFNSVIHYYENTLVLVQRIKLKANVTTTVKGNVTFMVCSNRECFPPMEKAFAIRIVDR